MVSTPDNLDALSIAVSEIREVYLEDERDWVLGFSGGKDSAATLRLVFLALLGIEPEKRTKTIRVLYCDTGVEIPPAQALTLSMLRDIEREAAALGLPISTAVVVPEVSDRYFVKVIGRGYPPPTNKFRWCTDRLRVKPVARFLRQYGSSSSSIVVLGVRRGESMARGRTIDRYTTSSDEKFMRQAGHPNTIIYSPIRDFDANLVWYTLMLDLPPYAIRGRQLARLYRDAAGECPLIRDKSDSACGTSRFGCWTCTVVSKDRAMEGLVRLRDPKLVPLLEFRNWLSGFRNVASARERTRRNRAIGPGPFTLSARLEVFRRLMLAESATNFVLLKPEEKTEIERLWRLDGYAGPSIATLERMFKADDAPAL